MLAGVLPRAALATSGHDFQLTVPTAGVADEWPPEVGELHRVLGLMHPVATVSTATARTASLVRRLTADPLPRETVEGLSLRRPPHSRPARTSVTSTRTGRSSCS